MDGVPPQRKRPTASWEQLGDVEEATSSGKGDEGCGDDAGNTKQDGEELADGEEGRAKPLPVPRMPSKAEWERHIVSHIPFGSWCRHCVSGRGLERRHLGR